LTTGGTGEAERTAVLLMAYGGPGSLEEVEPFLQDVRGGRPTPPSLVEEVRGRYAAIGGRSPLLERSREQARALQERLDADAPDRFRVYLGMRHWYPYIRQAVEEIAAAGHRRVVALVLAPHYSRLSVGAYRNQLEQARVAVGAPFTVHGVESWYHHGAFLDAVAEKLQSALAELTPEERARALVLFTAHSLPARILAEGDPYDAQLQETARRVAERCPGLDWRFCYQSAGAGGGPWLGPDLPELVAELARGGRRIFLVAPIGFVSDHVEILYDIDLEAAAQAAEHGARLVRTESLNASPLLVEALAAAVREALGSNTQQPA
jgi:ferrochelatase